MPKKLRYAPLIRVVSAERGAFAGQPVGDGDRPRLAVERLGDADQPVLVVGGLLALLERRRAAGHLGMDVRRSASVTTDHW